MPRLATIALVTGYRNQGNGQKDNTKTYAFGVKIPLAAGKRLASVTLAARVSAGKLHVFGMAIAS